jgi:hypothetical protein
MAIMGEFEALGDIRSNSSGPFHEQANSGCSAIDRPTLHLDKRFGATAPKSSLAASHVGGQSTFRMRSGKEPSVDN